MRECGFKFGDSEYEVHIQAQPLTTGGAIHTASVYRIDGHELETLSRDEISSSSEERAVERACEFLKEETGVDGTPFELPERKSPRVIRPKQGGRA